MLFDCVINSFYWLCISLIPVLPLSLTTSWATIHASMLSCPLRTKEFVALSVTGSRTTSTVIQPPGFYIRSSSLSCHFLRNLFFFGPPSAVCNPAHPVSSWLIFGG
ncbi:hypothetical protein CSKR_201899 [Clonorchis sinensis]|uniref:Uncharacterized protein n=1 Tax=Clonorchis sinensis TaxID=79923 RepID=A0A8T1MYV0_CLOSI|nr:hypothetical protein CSKR_201899 [Clonorchis sinensis]